MSLRRHVLRLVVLATAVAVCFSAFAGAASAKKYSAKQKAEIRKSLKKQIKKNPAKIRSKRFVRKAALVNFVLPVTIRLRNQCPAGTGGSGTCATSGTALNQTNDPFANVNLGPSLGQRQVSLSGSLAGEVQFADSYDGGALGNVNIKILPSPPASNKNLASSSVPLLWNPDVNTDPNTRHDVNFAKAVVRAGTLPGSLLGNVTNKTQGCADFNNQPNGWTFGTVAGQGGTESPVGTYKELFRQPNLIPVPLTGLPTGGVPGYGVTDPSYSTTQSAYFLPVFPGIDSPANVTGGVYSTGNNNQVGINPSPFPQGNNTAPGNFTQPPNAADTVLRTNALALGIAPAGVTVNGATGQSVNATDPTLTNGPQGTQSFVTGPSGGQANLFGNIPGKSSSIDVTVSLATKINSILRIVDQDVFKTPLVSGEPWPAGIFNCRQVWTGAVQNYIPGVRLTGQLRIAPAITKDGKLRIAKATVQTPDATRVALSACLMPYRSFGADSGTGPTGSVSYPSSGGAFTAPLLPTLGQAITGGLGVGPVPNLVQYNSTALPFVNSESAAPSNVPCNSTPTGLVRASGLTDSVEPQVPASVANGYTTNYNGSQATVGGDITVPGLDVDVLIGDN